MRSSEDGSHVYFVAKGVLTSIPNTSLASGQQVAVAGQDNLYVYERDSAFPNGHLAFVGDSIGRRWRGLVGLKTRGGVTVQRRTAVFWCS